MRVNTGSRKRVYLSAVTGEANLPLLAGSVFTLQRMQPPHGVSLACNTDGSEKSTCKRELSG